MSRGRLPRSEKRILQEGRHEVMRAWTIVLSVWINKKDHILRDAVQKESVRRGQSWKVRNSREVAGLGVRLYGDVYKREHLWRKDQKLC